jgi:outer membrane biosynthesis protein TonB
MRKIVIILAVLLFTAVLSGTINAQTADADKKAQSESGKEDKPLEIKKKPDVGYFDCSESSGLARVKVTFDKSETITNAELIIASGCESFDRQAVRAAKK